MNWWMVLLLISVLITGFTGGWIYAASLDARDVAEQYNQFIEDHCLCYENKPATTAPLWNYNFTEMQNGTRQV